MRLSDQDKLEEKTSTSHYFELIAIFAHRKKIRGMLNQKIHNAFSRFRQIAASGLSGSKLIFTISLSSLELVFFEGHRLPPSCNPF